MSWHNWLVDREHKYLVNCGHMTAEELRDTIEHLRLFQSNVEATSESDIDDRPLNKLNSGEFVMLHNIFDKARQLYWDCMNGGFFAVVYADHYGLKNIEVVSEQDTEDFKSWTRL